MQALQLQINTLSDKIDALHAAVERISEKLSESVEPTKVLPDLRSATLQYARPSTEISLGHKDILDDSPYLESHRNEQVLSPELQIQRLTAQLTAAYNRIASLEEQLLAKHVH